MLLCATCQQTNIEPQLKEIHVCGSSTMGRRLLPNLAVRWLNNGQTRSIETRPISSNIWCESSDKMRVCVHYSGSGHGWQLLQKNNCDIAMYSAPWTQKTTSYTATQVGTDAIMLVTKEGDPFKSTDIKELSEAYSGRKKIPGITLLMRKPEVNSGTSEAFRKMLFDVKKLKADANIPENKPYTILNRTDRWLYYISAQEQLITEELQIISVKEQVRDDHAYLPALDTMRSGRYPLIRPLFLVTKNNHTSSEAKDFVRYIASQEARPAFEALYMRHITSNKKDFGPILGPCNTQYKLPQNIGQRVNAIYYEPKGISMPSIWKYSLRSSIDFAHRTNQDLLVVGYASAVGKSANNIKFSRARARATVKIAAKIKKDMHIGNRDYPKIYCAYGGATTVWGPSLGDNRVTIIRTVDRKIP